MCVVMTCFQDSAAQFFDNNFAAGELGCRIRIGILGLM